MTPRGEVGILAENGKSQRVSKKQIGRVAAGLSAKLDVLADRPDAVDLDQHLALGFAKRLQDQAVRRYGSKSSATATLAPLERQRVAAELRAAEALTGRTYAAALNPLRLPANQQAQDRWTRAHLSAEVFARFPDMAQALTGTFVHKRLAYYGHDMPLDPATREPLLRMQGELVPWSRIARELKFVPGKNGQITGADGRVWEYLDRGFEPWDSKRWETMRPFEIRPPNRRPKTPELEVVTRPGELHAWFRLVLPSGEVYSAGVRAGSTPFKGYGLPASSIAARVSCPDLEEFLAEDDCVAARLPISMEKFAEIKARVEAYQRLGVHFNWIDHNCSVFTAQIANMAGAQIDLRTSLAELVLPEGCCTTYRRIPAALRKPLNAAASALARLGPVQALNLVLLLGGGWKGVRKDLDGNRTALRDAGALFRHPQDLLLNPLPEIQVPSRLKAWQQAQIASTAAAEIRAASESYEDGAQT